VLLDPDLHGWPVPHGPKASKWAVVFAVLGGVFGFLGVIVFGVWLMTVTL
jgi:hypothetical protein